MVRGGTQVTVSGRRAGAARAPAPAHQGRAPRVWEGGPLSVWVLARESVPVCRRVPVLQACACAGVCVCLHVLACACVHVRVIAG